MWHDLKNRIINGMGLCSGAARAPTLVPTLRVGMVFRPLCGLCARIKIQAEGVHYSTGEYGNKNKPKIKIVLTGCKT